MPVAEVSGQVDIAKVLTVAGVVLPSLLDDSEIAQVGIAPSGAELVLTIGLQAERSNFYVTFFTSPGQSLNSMAHHLFSELQDYLAESSIAWGTPRPLCPGHAHPRRLIEEKGNLWWTCPANDEGRARAFPCLDRPACA